jgi:Tol biopolymer transport system component
MNADGSDEHKLVETEFTTHHPDWHPDGTRLSFDTEFNLQGDIYLAPFQIEIPAFPTSS